MKRLSVILATLALTLSAQTEWHVAVDGKTIATGGNGSAASPWDLNTGLRGGGGGVKPGDTIWIKGGTYKGRYASTLVGTAALPIKVRNYAGQRATIDGLVLTTTTSVIASGNGGTNTSFYVASASGYSGNLMKVLVQYTPPGSSTMIEESMALRFTFPDANRMFVTRGPCKATAGVCPSFPIGSTVRAQGEILEMAGAYTWFWGLEVMYAQSTHVTGPGANPPYPNFDDAIQDRCNHCKLINLVVHDAGSNAIFSGAPGIGTELYGNIVFHNGFDKLGDRGHGHGAYLQNTPTGPPKIVADNFFFRGFGHGNQIYGTSSASLNNFLVEGNTYFNPAEPAGGNRGGTQYIIGDAGIFTGHVFKNNMTYTPLRGNVDIGYGGAASAPECKSPSITGNYLINRSNGLSLKVTCTTPTINGNSIYGSISGFNRGTYPLNTYLSTLTGQKVFVRPNKYEPGRANIIVYNWSNALSATVNVSGIGLVNGDSYEVRDVQNFYGPPVLTGTYNGSSIMIPLNNTLVTQPIGTIAVAPIPHTSGEFNAFVIQKAVAWTANGSGKKKKAR